jgi:hypothetical protein
MSLPAELGGIVQPYSMGPLLRWNRYLLGVMAVPPMSTLVNVDRSEHMIRMCLVAPARVQRAAQAAGVTQMVMIRPRGIELVDPRLKHPEPVAKGRIVDMIEGLS